MTKYEQGTMIPIHGNVIGNLIVIHIIKLIYERVGEETSVTTDRCSSKAMLVRVLGLILCLEDWKFKCGMVQLHVCAHTYTCEGVYMHM